MHIKPPDAKEVVIDPKLTHVNWDLEGNVYGVTIYRPLSEGRWVVNATTNGALTLVRKKDGEKIKLIAPPPIRQFEEIQKEVNTKVEEISDLIKQESDRLPLNILGYTEQPLASCDFNHDPRSSIVDLSFTRVSGGTLVEILIWFDTEWAYANRMLDVAQYLADNRV